MQSYIHVAGKWAGRLLVAGLALGAAALGRAVGAPAGDVPPVKITIETKESTAPIPITVQAGSRFTIALPSNVTTGYKWKLAGTPDARVVTLVSSTYAAPNTGRVGQGGSEAWVFAAKGAGKATLTLQYARPWERNTPPAKSQAFVVTVP